MNKCVIDIISRNELRAGAQDCNIAQDTNGTRTQSNRHFKHNRTELSDYWTTEEKRTVLVSRPREGAKSGCLKMMCAKPTSTGTRMILLITPMETAMP